MIEQKRPGHRHPVCDHTRDHALESAGLINGYPKRKYQTELHHLNTPSSSTFSIWSLTLLPAASFISCWSPAKRPLLPESNRRIRPLFIFSSLLNRLWIALFLRSWSSRCSSSWGSPSSCPAHQKLLRSAEQPLDVAQAFGFYNPGCSSRPAVIQPPPRQRSGTAWVFRRKPGHRDPDRSLSSSSCSPRS